jgi:hypothetical protein
VYERNILQKYAINMQFHGSPLSWKWYIKIFFVLGSFNRISHGQFDNAAFWGLASLTITLGIEWQLKKYSWNMQNNASISIIETA